MVDSSREAADVKSYLDTIDRIEKNIHPIDASAFYASAAISLKRIAAADEAIAASFAKLANPPMEVGPLGGDLPNIDLFNPDGSRKFPK